MKGRLWKNACGHALTMLVLLRGWPVRSRLCVPAAAATLHVLMLLVWSNMSVFQLWSALQVHATHCAHTKQPIGTMAFKLHHCCCQDFMRKYTQHLSLSYRKAIA